MKEKRYNFRGHRIEPKVKKESKIKRERDFSFLWMLLPVFGLLFLVVFIFPMLMGITDIIEGTYTIKIYVPDCDNGELFYSESSVSGQYLYDNDFAERRYLVGDELKPVIDYQKWDRYVFRKIGKYIPDDNCCIEFIKE